MSVEDTECPQCGAELGWLDDEAAFCPYCGAELDQEDMS
jgi:endogenous inhibitor of DNA gyrase (YacG/DUF329 family)